MVNVKFAKKTMDGEKKRNLVSIVRSFMERGGVELQINTVDRKTLEDARRDPDSHRSLIVRIGGYSDYFVKLSPKMQEEVILRTSHSI